MGAKKVVSTTAAALKAMMVLIFGVGGLPCVCVYIGVGYVREKVRRCFRYWGVLCLCEGGWNAKAKENEMKGSR